ncbi:MAG: sigma-70 family RNA polymerase sigma factor [Opitutaceae bacterium]|nr:sigma-70 family RNA polymerase sigma factor [Opitutaceae bacterium]
MTTEEHEGEGAALAAQGRHAFATTHWTMVVRAADAGTSEGQAALEELCRTYWPPLYGFARRYGIPPADAEDLTQGFFEDLLVRGALACADASRGHFRTFLLTSFRNYQAHQRARAGTQRRGGDQTIVSLDALREAEAQYQEEPATTQSPDRLYDRKWALCLLATALAAVRREYAAIGRAAVFEELRTVVWGGRGQVGYAEIARRLNSTEGAIKVAVHRLRHRFGEQVRVEVAKTLLSPEHVEEEIRHLLAAVSN